MISHLISHEWKSAYRSVMRSQNIVGGIVFGAFLILMAFYFLSLGFVLGSMLRQANPNVEPVTTLNSVILYYFLFDIFLRFMLQGTPSVLIDPYRLLPVKKSTLIHYLLAKSFLSAFNVLPLLVFVPFCFISIRAGVALFPMLAWLVTMVMAVGCSSLLNFRLKKLVIANSGIVAAAAAAVLLLFGLDSFNIVPFSKAFGLLIGQVMQKPFFIVIPAAVISLLYLLNYSLLLDHSYNEDLQSMKRRSSYGIGRLAGIREIGNVGPYIALELKLLFRHRRTRIAIFYSCFMFVAAGCFYTSQFLLSHYPQPGGKHSSASIQQPVQPGISTHRVLFRLASRRVPPGAWVYVTGSIAGLGNWNPSEVCLDKINDTLWSGEVVVPADSPVGYKFTLGTWRTQALTADRNIPENSSLRAGRDTTIDVRIDQWGIPTDGSKSEFVISYIGFFLTGVLIISYGGFLLVSEGSYFDFLLVRNIDLPSYFRAKFILMATGGCLFYLLSLPFAYFGMGILASNTAMALYHIGINSFIVSVMATFSRTTFDLNAGLYSFQGKGASQFLTAIPLIVFPMGIYSLAVWLASPAAGLAILAGLGAAGIIFHRQLIGIVIMLFEKQKYKMAAGFRNT